MAPAKRKKTITERKTTPRRPPVYWLKLSTGDELMSTIAESAKTVVMDNPMSLMSSMDAMVLLPFAPFAKTREMTVPKSWIVVMEQVSDQMATYYHYSAEYATYYCADDFSASVERSTAVAKKMIDMAQERPPVTADEVEKKSVSVVSLGDESAIDRLMAAAKSRGLVEE